MDRYTNTQEPSGGTTTLSDEERLIDGPVEMLSIEELVGIRDQARPGGMTTRLLGHIQAQGEALIEARDQLEGLKKLNQGLTSDFDASLTALVDEAKGQSFAQVFQQLQAALTTIHELEGSMVDAVGDLRASGKAVYRLRQDVGNERRHVAQLQHELANARRNDNAGFEVFEPGFEQFAVDFATYVWNESRRRGGRTYGYGR
jgi:hypothetical protein